jgi:3D-(3,5/4)-trihydroxycyclohexane-1,2-dione acylhydrolase (decyclizing)
MAHAAIAFAKTHRRRRMMACTSSLGPGATNMVTAAALAHVNRLPLLLLPGDVFANRATDPVLQQVEDFGDGTVSPNDCFRPCRAISTASRARSKSSRHCHARCRC